MKKVWHRTFHGWWYLTLAEGGNRQQIKLVKGPNDKETKAAAERQAIQELATRQHVEDNADKAPSWATAGHVIRAFLKHSAEEHSKETAAWHRYLLTSFLDLYGKVRLTRLRKMHVRAWLAAKGYNPTSANRAVGALKRAFNWAVEEEHIPRNPLAHVRKPKSLVRDRTLTPEERLLILKSIRGPSFRTFVRALTLTGCRPGEVARVTAADVDLDKGLWVFHKHKTAKKTGRPRLVFLSPEALDLTKELMDKNPDGPLFLNSRGKPWTRNAIRIRFRNLRRRHPELKGIVAYSYRSSFATDALEIGVPDTTVAALLGHTNTATLHKHYARLSGRLDHLKDAAARATRKPAAGDVPGGTAG